MVDENEQGNIERVRLVDDAPVDEDRFEGRAHNAVATAIADLVTTEPGGRVIGLEGAWGSGKSTIVRLLSGVLQKRNSGKRSGPEAQEVRVVMFDTWAHQGDPLRRTFLETLVDSLAEWNWLTAKESAEWKTRLAGKTAKTHTTTSPRLTTEGKITATSALLIPFGVAAIDNDLTRFHDLLAYIGIGLTFAPLIVIIVIALVAYGRRRRGHRETRRVSYFAEERETETITESIEMGEPTSVEFERFFRDILSEAVTEKRRLVLVLDNLDRVSEGDGRAVLATMQTFTSPSLRTAKDPWRERVWTMIPFDRDGLDRLWQSNQHDSDGESKTPTSSMVPTAFLEKLFEIRFRTPPLVLSNWRDYLFSLLREALPDRRDEELRRIERLRAVYPESNPVGSVAHEEPTPRQLKQFVNSVGAILRQRGDIPIVDVAYYCLLQRDGMAEVADLMNSDIPHRRVAYLLTPETRQHLAALYFGTSAELAAQLLLRDPVLDAIRGSHIAVLEDLAGRVGFADTMDGLDLSAMAVDGGVELTRMVSVLDDANLLSSDVLSGWVDDCLRPQVMSGGTTWKLVGSRTGRGLAVLCGLLLSMGVRPQLLSRVEPITPGGSGSGFDGLEALAALEGGLDGLGLGDTFRVTLAFPDELLISALAFYRSQTGSDRALAALDLTTKPDAVSALLLPVATGDNPAPALQALQALVPRPERFSSVKLLEGCATWLREHDPVSGEQLGDLLRIVDTLRPTDSGATIGALSDDGTLMHCVSFAHGRGWELAAAMASLLFLATRAITLEQPGAREAPAGMALLRQALRTPKDLSALVDAQSAWLGQHRLEALRIVTAQVAADPTALPWAKHQISALARMSQLEVTPEQLTEYAGMVEDALSRDAFQAVLAGIIGEKRGVEVVTTTSQDPVLANRALEAVGSEPTLQDAKPDVVSWALRLVHDAPLSSWSQGFSSTTGSPIIELALSLVRAGEKPDPVMDLDDAIGEHAERLESGQDGWEPPGEEFAQVAGLLSPATQSVLASRLVSGLEGRDGVIAQSFFSVYGPFLAEHASSRTHEKLPSIVERLLAKEQWSGVAWFVDLAKAHEDVLDRSEREDGFTNLEEKASARAEAYDDKSQPPAELLGLLALLRAGDEA